MNMGDYDISLLALFIIDSSSANSSALVYSGVYTNLVVLGFFLLLPFLIIGTFVIAGFMKRIHLLVYDAYCFLGSGYNYCMGTVCMDVLKNNYRYKTNEKFIMSSCDVCADNIPIDFEKLKGYGKDEFSNCDYVMKVVQENGMPENSKCIDGEKRSAVELSKSVPLDYLSRAVIYIGAHCLINRNAKIPLFMAEYEMGCNEYPVYNARRSQYRQWYCFFELIPTSRKRFKYALYRLYEGVLIGYDYNNFGVLAAKRRIDELYVTTGVKSRIGNVCNRIERFLVGH